VCQEAKFGVVGRVEARDTKTGKLVSRRPTVEGHMGTLDGKDNGVTGKLNASWPGETWKVGGAATWLGGTYDPATGLLYFGTGNPGPWNRASPTRTLGKASLLFVANYLWRDLESCTAWFGDQAVFLSRVLSQR
jgi:glucose dehydrogenase